MTTSVTRAKSTALGKEYNPSHGPTKHRKGHFTPKRTDYIISPNLKNIKK